MILLLLLSVLVGQGYAWTALRGRVAMDTDTVCDAEDNKLSWMTCEVWGGDWESERDRRWWFFFEISRERRRRYCTIPSLSWVSILRISMITSCEEIKVKSKINEAQSDVQNKIRNLSLDEDKPAEKARSMPMVTSPHCSALHIYTLYEARGKSCYLLPATCYFCCLLFYWLSSYVADSHKDHLLSYILILVWIRMRS